jgi:hypothetical protein
VERSSACATMCWCEAMYCGADNQLGTLLFRKWTNWAN